MKYLDQENFFYTRSTDPDPTLGEAGDIWLNTTSLELFIKEATNPSDTIGVWQDSGVNLRGPIGPQGDQGPRGIQGIQGIQGDPGGPGSTGSRGVQGFQGDGTEVTSTTTGANPGDVSTVTFTNTDIDGGTGLTTTSAQTVTIQPGVAGSDGTMGNDGAAGADGVTATVAAGVATGLPAGDTPTAVLDPTSTAINSIFNFGIPAGATGADGAAGSAGAAGERGFQGRFAVSIFLDYDTALTSISTRYTITSTTGIHISYRRIYTTSRLEYRCTRSDSGYTI